MSTYSLTGTFKTSSGITSGYKLGTVEIDDEDFPSHDSQRNDMLISIAENKFSGRIASADGELIRVQCTRIGV